LTLPANVRINPNVPFPSLVIGSGPITVSKNFGIWTIGFSVVNLPTQPGPINNSTDLILVYDSVGGNFFNLPLSAIASSGARQQRSIQVVGDLPLQSTDQTLNVNGAGLNIIIPLASTRAGVPFTFKRVDSAPSFTLTATAPDTIDGLASLVVNTGSITLVPYNDGVNNSRGYGIV
jgi:hypothetical protein